jgi:predicted DNA-binding protein YlxM (UPF0122 family)
VPKDLNVVLLLDYYGGLLPDKQRRLVEYYYCDDLSLAEISEAEGITRQGARDAIVRAVAKMKQFEETVGFVKKATSVRDALDKYAVSQNNEDFDKLCVAINNM